MGRNEDICECNREPLNSRIDHTLTCTTTTCKYVTHTQENNKLNRLVVALGDGDVAGADHADERVVAAVAVDRVVVLRALLRVACSRGAKKEEKKHTY